MFYFLGLTLAVPVRDQREPRAGCYTHEKTAPRQGEPARTVVGGIKFSDEATSTPFLLAGVGFQSLLIIVQIPNSAFIWREYSLL